MAGTMHSLPPKGSNGSFRLILTAICGVMIGFFIGASFPKVPWVKVEFPRLSQNARVDAYLEKINSELSTNFPFNSRRASLYSSGSTKQTLDLKSGENFKIHVPTNPRGVEPLVPGIIESSSDLYLRRLWGDPSEDLVLTPKYLLVLTVGYPQKDIINTLISKFSENFSFLLFHYDGRTSEWEEFEWSQRAIHVSARKQTKWWYAKRFLHPDIVAPYDYIFIWDEDLGVEHFNALEYLELVRKHGLEISQPGLEENNFLTWRMTRRRVDVEVHKKTEERPGWCHDPYLPPCAGFVEIMAPVFSRKSWRCVWHMIQNDLVHGWGLDLALQRCVEPAHEKIGVVDAQWIVHKVLPSLGDQGEAKDGRQPWEGVRVRCQEEWAEFQGRLEKSEKDYLNLTLHGSAQ